MGSTRRHPPRQQQWRRRCGGTAGRVTSTAHVSTACPQQSLKVSVVMSVPAGHTRDGMAGTGAATAIPVPGQAEGVYSGQQAPRGRADLGQRRRGRLPGRPRGERGSTTTETVLYAPLLMLLLLAGVQLAMWALGQVAAQHAANHALQTTRVAGGSATAGQADANAALDQLAATLIRDRQVSVTRDAEHAEVIITGTAPTVVPFLRLPVHTRVRAPVEKFRHA